MVACDGRITETREQCSYLEHVEHAEVLETTLFGVVDLGSLDDDRVRGKIDAPRQGGRAHEHLFLSVARVSQKTSNENNVRDRERDADGC